MSPVMLQSLSIPPPSHFISFIKKRFLRGGVHLDVFLLAQIYSLDSYSRSKKSHSIFPLLFYRDLFISLMWVSQHKRKEGTERKEGYLLSPLFFIA